MADVEALNLNEILKKLKLEEVKILDVEGADGSLLLGYLISILMLRGNYG